MRECYTFCIFGKNSQSIFESTYSQGLIPEIDSISISKVGTRNLMTEAPQVHLTQVICGPHLRHAVEGWAL